MKIPWGATHFPLAGWSSSGKVLTVSNIQGSSGDIELVFITAPATVNVPITASGAGGSFGTNSVSMPGSTGYVGAVGSSLISWRARILSSSDTHSVTADATSLGGLWQDPTVQATEMRRLDVFIISNPMDVTAADLLNMVASKHYSDSGGFGASVTLPNLSSRKTFGYTRLDFIHLLRQYDDTGSIYSGYSFPNLSFDSNDVSGFSTSPYYGTAIQSRTTNPGASTARTTEIVARYTNNSLSSNRWAESASGSISYSNKVYNSSSGTYVSLNTYCGGFSFAFPNYEYSKMVL